jgi:hypothetical protein
MEDMTGRLLGKSSEYRKAPAFAGGGFSMLAVSRRIAF